MAPKDVRDTGRSAVENALRVLGLQSGIDCELAGGASPRRFFRLREAGAPLVAMYAPPPEEALPEARQAVGHDAFVLVRELLAAEGLPVPRIHHDARDHDVLIVDDLGPHTLAAYLDSHPERRAELYTQAVETLARAQSVLSPRLGDSIVAGRAFDASLLSWELDHFSEWALGARGRPLHALEAAIFERARDYLAREIAAWPRCFVHRDYQSKNLMVQERAGRLTLTWIDFQDAMLGPRAYDLVALLMDSYQTFDDAFVADRLAEYARARGTDDLERLRLEFDLVTIQRKLKDAGRFVFIERVLGNDSFLEYVQPSIEKARAALGRAKHVAPELEALDQLLGDLFGPALAASSSARGALASKSA